MDTSKIYIYLLYLKLVAAIVVIHEGMASRMIVSPSTRVAMPAKNKKKSNGFHEKAIQYRKSHILYFCRRYEGHLYIQKCHYRNQLEEKLRDSE